MLQSYVEMDEASEQCCGGRGQLVVIECGLIGGVVDMCMTLGCLIMLIEELDWGLL